MPSFIQSIRFLVLSVFVSGSLYAAKVEVVVTNPIETDLAVANTLDTQKTWIEMISGAKQTIDIEQFYISDKESESLVPVLEAIRKAAKNKVKVRLLADKKFFTQNYPETVEEFGGLENMEARTIDYGEGVQHAKFFIVDGKEFYIGSANFDWRALTHIHELGLKVEDTDLATSLGAVFDTDWAKGVQVGNSTLPATAARKVVNKGKSGDLQLVGSPPDKLPKDLPYSLDAIISLIGEAKTKKDSVFVQVMDYSLFGFGVSGKGWSDLDNALRAAAKRGASVRLMVESSKVKKNSKELKGLVAAGVEVKGVKIPEAKEGPIEFARMIHSKYLIVNGKRAWVGTDNWTKSYFVQSRGVGLIVDSANTVDTLEAVYEKLWESDYAKPVK